MPVPLSHTESSLALVDGRILVFGGTSHRDVIESGIYAYDPEADSWEQVGNLPCGIKGPVVGLWKDHTYIFSGQRTTSTSNPFPADITPAVWSAPIPAGVRRGH